MSTETTAPTMTAEEFCEWVHRPENQDKWFELVRGEIIELPPSMKRHGAVCGNSAGILSNYTFQQGKGYITTNDSGVILERDPDTVRGPDVALYEDAATFDELHPKYGEVPPRLAVEVMSPNDRASFMTRKVMDYLRSGVALVWLLDPEARTLTVYRSDRGPRQLSEGDEVTEEDILPGFRCNVADFFRVPGSPAK
jgi:Uma2 family endonuclease